MKEVEKGEWDYLLASRLQEDDDQSSYAGSHMLSTFREQLCIESIFNASSRVPSEHSLDPDERFICVHK
jgi:hypothetical protein